MSDPVTPNLGLIQPIVGADNNTWGTAWNQNAATIDVAFGQAQAQRDTVVLFNATGVVAVPAANLYGICTAGAGGISLTLPSAAAAGIGRKLYFVKDDTAVGIVSIIGTVRGSPYQLINQDQWVEVESDGTNWRIRANN